MIQICAFKKKDKDGGEGRPQFGGLWKVPSLVVLAEISCLVVNGRFQCLIAFRTRRRSIIFTFPPNKFYLDFISFILKCYFTMVLYFMPFLFFP
jgi:hypothetical protein